MSSGISSEDSSVQYATIQDAIRFVKSVGISVSVSVSVNFNYGLLYTGLFCRNIP